MTTTFEKRQMPADTIVPCPTWCDRDHTIDTDDNSGVHWVDIATEPMLVRLGQGFGDGEVDPAMVYADGTELSKDACTALAAALTQAVALMTGETA